jgi:hypothetical protein
MDSDVAVGFMVVLALMGFLTLVVGFGMRYGSLEDRYGKLAAKRLFPGEVIVGVPLALAVVAILWMAKDKQDAIGAVLFLLAALEVWMALLILTFGRTNIGKIQLDLGIVDKAGYWTIVFLALYSAMRLLDSAVENELGVKDIARISFVVSFAIAQFLRNRVKTLVTEKGIYTNSQCIKWKQIKRYEWGKNAQEQDVLLVKVKRWLPLFNTRVFMIPPDYKSDVSDLLAQYASVSALFPKVHR